MRTGKPEQQQFTIRSGVLFISISCRQRSAITGGPLPERTSDPQSAAIDRPMSQQAALWPSPSNVLRQQLNILVQIAFNIRNISTSESETKLKVHAI